MNPIVAWDVTILRLLLFVYLTKGLFVIFLTLEQMKFVQMKMFLVLLLKILASNLGRDQDMDYSDFSCFSGHLQENTGILF
jgi:hypothetical protein